MTKQGLVGPPGNKPPIIDLPASRILVDGTHLYLFANGAIARAYK